MPKKLSLMIISLAYKLYLFVVWFCKHSCFWTYIEVLKIFICYVGLFCCIVQLGGPFWNVRLGRRDSRSANFTAANTGVIPPPTSNLTNLITRFRDQGLSARDMVALSGISLFSSLSYFSPSLISPFHYMNNYSFCLCLVETWDTF